MFGRQEYITVLADEVLDFWHKNGAFLEHWVVIQAEVSY